MTYDNKCQLCGDLCWMSLIELIDNLHLIPDWQRDSVDVNDIPVLTMFKKNSKAHDSEKQKYLGKVKVIKPFIYNDNRSVCVDCWKGWNANGKSIMKGIITLKPNGVMIV